MTALSRYHFRGLTRLARGRDVQAALVGYLKTHAPRAKPTFRKAEKKAVRESAKAARQAVRLACEIRAQGKCESCLTVPMLPLEMDHFLGRAHSEYIETCWMLCRRCHHMKTENRPTRAAWDEAFGRHCEWHGYSPVSRLTKDIPRSAK